MIYDQKQFIILSFGVLRKHIKAVFGRAPRPCAPPPEPEAEAGAANCGSTFVFKKGSCSSKCAEALLAPPFGAAPLAPVLELLAEPERHQTGPKIVEKGENICTIP
jgi:hypothetical protein